MAIQKAKAFPTFAKSFKQPNPGVTASGGHTSKLINPKHPPMKGSHAESMAPQHKRTAIGQIGHPDHKPSVAKRQRTNALGVAGPNMGNSDVNSEAIGSQMGPAPNGSTPNAFKAKAVKSKQLPFYGSMK